MSIEERAKEYCKKNPNSNYDTFIYAAYEQKNIDDLKYLRKIIDLKTLIQKHYAKSLIYLKNQYFIPTSITQKWYKDFVQTILDYD